MLIKLPDRFPGSAETSRPPFQSGVEQVAQGVAEHVDTEHDDGQTDTGPQGQPGGLQHVFAAFQTEHAAPTGLGWRNAESEETDFGFGENGASQGNGEHDDNGRDQLRQDMPPEDPPGATAHRPGCLHVHVFLSAEHHASNDASPVNPPPHSDHNDDRDHPPGQNGHEGDDDEQRRKGHESIDQPLQEDVELPAPVAGNQAEQDCNHNMKSTRAQPDNHRDAGPVDDPAENVSSEIIRPQDKFRSGCVQSVANTEFIDTVGGQKVCKNADEQKYQNQQAPESSYFFLAEQPGKKFP